MNSHKSTLAPGLYFVATPIGTARDITLRALDILSSAEVIAAEDTRSLRKLMEIHGIALNGRRIVAYHDHSGAAVRERLIAAVADGQSVAYASEAGMPLVADPGFELGRAMAQAGLPVTVAPGASAVLAALAISGLPSDAFFFAGFLPSASSARRARLEALRDIPGTLIFFESPRRVAAMIVEAQVVLGGSRQAAICREITKKFEEVRRGTLDELAAGLEGASLKGEVVVLIARGDSEKISDSDLETDLKAALGSMSMKDAADAVSKAHDLPRRKVYQLALKLGKDRL
ncbi:16S rRNA (cytidine(1402)-2'-O)-methyltransferase [Aestuariivita sp.]|uniref:16S rRNA (cytidine(1402)-2'-O)-methyltransferase n=1 Tax=Aestuariivita sp. TaxID=1872407 RepID=UPI002170AFF3|nr:16S rRNA (cytidine(1402)-2'-O)-methyltransferase [Aestuariivita sp.]MCE8007582.1 16S rRNA (cytidine(1402)-2'-O)-methyltransferase [Aestuariivita sp.]